MSVRLQVELPDAEYRALLKIATARKVQAHVLVEGLVRKALVPRPPAMKRYHPRIHDVPLIRLHGEGWSDSQIGRHFGFAHTTIAYHRNRLGLPKNVNSGRKPKGGEGNEAVSVLRAAGPDPSDQLDGNALG